MGLIPNNPNPVTGPLRTIGFVIFWIDVVLLVAVLVKAVVC